MKNQHLFTIDDKVRWISMDGIEILNKKKAVDECILMTKCPDLFYPDVLEISEIPILEMRAFWVIHLN